MSGKADDLSRLVYSTLDTFGFKLESVLFRSKVIDYISNIASLNIAKEGSPHSVVIAGSAGEGVAFFDSDRDLMIIFGDTICVDEASAQSHFNILEADCATSSPGYTKIVPAYLDKRSDSMSHFMLKSSYMYADQTGHPYVSSAVFRNYVHQFITKHYTGNFDCFKFGNVSNNGPATTNEIIPLGEQDIVNSIYYFGDAHLRKWRDRTRFNVWPSINLVKEISQMEGYIVPVGDKLSDSHFLEWRVCYTSAEKKLISTFNDVQVKLYVLLKLIGKELLKPVCKEMTSYIMKNVAFWVVESEPTNSFSPALLLKLVQRALFFLKHCLENNHFPNYMIPERNLLAVVFGRNKYLAICFLSDCLKDERAMVLRIPKLRELLHSSYTPLEKAVYSEWRNETEEALFALMILHCEHFEASLMQNRTFVYDLIWKCLKDERYMETCAKCVSMLVPECLMLKEEEIVETFARRLRDVWPL